MPNDAIDLNAPHATIERNQYGTFDVWIPRGNLMVGATGIRTYGAALDYVRAEEPDMPIRIK